MGETRSEAVPFAIVLDDVAREHLHAVIEHMLTAYEHVEVDKKPNGNFRVSAR
jgi:hypothetical protein